MGDRWFVAVHVLLLIFNRVSDQERAFRKSEEIAALLGERQTILNSSQDSSKVVTMIHKY
jgi:hypothetical protein